MATSLIQTRFDVGTESAEWMAPITRGMPNANYYIKPPRGFLSGHCLSFNRQVVDARIEKRDDVELQLEIRRILYFVTPQVQLFNFLWEEGFKTIKKKILLYT